MNNLAALLPKLRRYCYSLTGKMQDAEDLLQSTLERILTNPVPEGLATDKWAFRISANLWIDWYRTKQRKPESEMDTDTLTQLGDDSETQMEHKISLLQVNDAMAKLPVEQRQVLSLISIKGFSYQEVAEILQVPVGTVMSRLARARSSLTQMMLTDERRSGT